MTPQNARPVWILWLAVAACGSDASDGTLDPVAGSTSSTAGTASSTAADTTADDGPVESGPSSTGPADETSPAPTTEGGSDGDSDDGSDDGPLPAGCYDYDAFEPFPVGFRDAVMPILAAACSSCHADPTRSIYFGTGGTSEAEAAAVYDKLLNGGSIQAPALDFVTPGDPLHSYMMAKVEYAVPGATCAEVQCAEPGCELPAPPAGPIAESDKAILRSWILGGALDD